MTGVQTCALPISNFIIMRLADIILLEAEADNELGKLSAAANLLNQIRTRVHLPNTTAFSKEEMESAILNERRLELAFEGQRWFDLVRTGKLIEVMRSDGYNVSKKNLLFPLPQSEIDRDPNLTQNPGY